MKLFKILFLISLIFSNYSTQASIISKAAQTPFKKALEFNAMGDYVSALNSFIESYNIDAGVLGLDNEGILDNSTKFFQRYLQNNPKDLNSLMWLGSIFALKGDLKTSIEYYQKVTMFAPKSEEAKEADIEIISLEKSLREQQNEKNFKVEKKQQDLVSLNKVKENVTREVKKEYNAAISKLEEQITLLERQVTTANQETSKAKAELEASKSKFEGLETELSKYKFLYRKYRRKSGSNF
ncbi:MAG: hypothetical protein COB02_16050 [Candidatus Cloacimonadota bacterium]|nr:MAG: hypothetical protein COB02_16050 [Candidatus Cloacimonadota bacterium]